MAKKRTAKKRAGSTKRASSRKSGRSAETNFDRLKRHIDPDARNALNEEALAKIESLSRAEVEALISSHEKLSPRKRWDPEPDGSIF